MTLFGLNIKIDGQFTRLNKFRNSKVTCGILRNFKHDWEGAFENDVM